MGGGIIGWYQSSEVQKLGLDGLYLIVMHACQSYSCIVVAMVVMCVVSVTVCVIICDVRC